MRGRKRHVKKWARQTAIVDRGYIVEMSDKLARAAYRCSRCGAIAVRIVTSNPRDWCARTDAWVHRAPGKRRHLVAWTYERERQSNLQPLPNRVGP